MNKGKIISIEGTDGSGKQTQSKLLSDGLNQKGIKNKMFSFPNYGCESSFFVKQYLSGIYSKDSNAVLGKVASTFYALDRYHTYQTILKKQLEENNSLVFDRYTESNIIHQAIKEADFEQMLQTAKWIIDFEQNILRIPKSDKVFYLYLEKQLALKLLLNRKENDGLKHDIHEIDLDYQEKVRNVGITLAQEFNWEIIECGKNGKIRDIEDIHEEILSKTLKLF